ncbi:MAG: methyltransferase domain-containing protein [Pyrinomonadaceae bacterium]
MPTPRPSESAPTAYDDFAWFYDRHWVTEVGEHFFSAVDQLLLPNLSPGAEILDLCCGTGHLASDLNDRGYRVIGIDSSKEMLRLARVHAPKAEFVEADARSYPSTRQVDAVTCVFDSINHFLKIADAELVFRTARQALKPGGQFLFDVNTEPAFSQHWEQYYAIVEDDHACVLTGEYSDSKHRAYYDITLFRLLDGQWRRFDTRIEERCYSIDELKSALLNAGFDEIRVYAADTDLGLTDHTGRAFFVCS